MNGERDRRESMLVAQHDDDYYVRLVILFNINYLFVYSEVVISIAVLH